MLKNVIYMFSDYVRMSFLTGCPDARSAITGIGTIFDFISCELDFQYIFKSIKILAKNYSSFCAYFLACKISNMFHKIAGPCAEWRWFILLHPSWTMGLIGINFRSDGFSCCPLTFRHFYPESKGWLFFFVSRVFWLFAALENFFSGKSPT